jgi:hypothetical protein
MTRTAEWINGGQFYDGEVWDTDFYDPDVSGATSPYDDDTHYMDATGSVVAISYFSGHGFAPNTNNVACHVNSDCPSPPSGGGYAPGICTYCPTAAGHIGCDPAANGGGICRYWFNTTIALNGSSSHHGQSVAWGAPNGGIVFGESEATGGWATQNGKKAGTNGGINMLVLVQSYGGTPGLWQYETKSMFGGLHLLGMTSPTDGDYDADSRADRGSTFASQYAMDPLGSVGDAWISSGASLTEGDGCNSDGYNAGGYNGCGCTTVISWDRTAPLAAFHVLTESWNQLKDDLDYDAKGTGYWHWSTSCNYDITNYPFSKS